MGRIKKKSRKLILFAALITVLFFIASCSSPECKADSDCSSGKCLTARCQNSKCVSASQPDCCGNKIKEEKEDGRSGDKCTCPADYGKCDGKGKIKVGSRLDDALYVHYYCNSENACALGVDEKDVSPQNILDDINLASFKATSIVRFNRPFNVGRDTFEFKITLEDAGKDLILPVQITGLKILYTGSSAKSELLIADRQANYVLDGVGREVNIVTNLNLNYKPAELEDSGSFRYKLDYEYKSKVPIGRNPDGTTSFNEEVSRGTYTSPGKPAFFFRNG